MSEWIDVRQTLPHMARDRGYGPCSDRVLVYRPYLGVRTGILNRPEQYDMWWMDEDDCEISVTHWMPFPDPPEAPNGKG